MFSRLLARPRYQRIGSQIPQELLHAKGAITGVLDILIPGRSEFSAEFSFQKLAVGRYHAQRFLQIVRCGIRELLQIGIRSTKRRTSLADLTLLPLVLRDIAR